jgi:hypothetical protein
MKKKTGENVVTLWAGRGHCVGLHKSVEIINGEEKERQK